VNILGRYLYLDVSIPSEPTEQEQINQETQKKYLAFYEYFLNTGLKQLCDHIRKYVAEELADWPLTRKLTLEEVLIIFANIRSRVEGFSYPPPSVATVPTNRPPSLYQFLLPPEDTTTQKDLTDKKLICLINETRDILESEQFDQVLKACLETSYTMLADLLKDSFMVTNSPQLGVGAPANATTIVEPTQLPMPKVLPLIKTRCKNILEVAPQQDAKSSLIQILFSLPNLEDFSSSIFTSSYEEQ